MNDLLARFFKGNPQALARILTKVENRTDDSLALLKALYPHSGRARVVGITGSPGTGKSTLVGRLAAAYREEGRRVGIAAVDPTSLFTGGAILGDRIRMGTLGNDPGIYIRSMATRGWMGGLAAATADVVTVLDAAGRDPILVETVGVGQDEIEVVKVVDVSLVVLVPGMGDDVQALKAGIMEIGDIFVINKCDRPGVGKTERSLESVLSLGVRSDGWTPPIVRVVATRGDGIERLRGAIDDCCAVLRRSPEHAQGRRHATRKRLVALLEERLARMAIMEFFPNGEFNEVVERILRREQDPYSVVEQVIRSCRFQRSEP